LAAGVKSWLKRCLGNRAITRMAMARLSGAVLIVAYHDIRRDGGPGNWLRVPESEFNRQLDWLSTLGRFITPDEVPAEAVEGQLSRRAGADDPRGGARAAGGGDAAGQVRPHGLRILLTFDDGYVNNYRLAWPILRRHGAPALFFISTWHAATGEPYWFDRVAVPIQADERTELDLRDVGLQRYRFRPGDSAGRWDDIQRLLADIKSVGNPGHPAVDLILERCDAASGDRGRAALADCRPLQTEEIRAMQASGLCRFGSHSHRHEILTYLDTAAIAGALRDSVGHLEAVLSAPPLDLAYPNGDVDERVLTAARAAGFHRGYTVVPGLVLPRAAPLRLPRLLIGGYDTAEVLAFKLNRVLLRAAARRNALRDPGPP
jgi:peptidoglycan/xylan/chitin deacetylase (PgdA/CDA1 family)